MTPTAPDLDKPSASTTPSDAAPTTSAVHASYSCTGIRRHPSRRSDDQIPHRDPVARPVQQPAQKQACRPMPIPISSAGVAAARKAPFGTPEPMTATAATTTAAPPTNPWMHQPSHLPWLTAAYQAFPPATPAATAATASNSGSSTG